MWIRCENGVVVNLERITHLKVTKLEREADSTAYELRAWMWNNPRSEYFAVASGTQAECEHIRDWLAEEMLDAGDVRAAIDPPRQGRDPKANPFKVGDLVICLDATDGAHFLYRDQTYTVDAVEGNRVGLSGMARMWEWYRFVKAPTFEPTQGAAPSYDDDRR